MNKQDSIDPNTIQSLTRGDKSLEIRFKEGSVLKCKLSACVFSSNDSLFVGNEIVFPSPLLVGGKQRADGQARCRNPECDCILDAEAVGGYCWPCAKKLDGVFVAIAAAKHLKENDAETLVHDYLKQNPVDDLASIKGDKLLGAVMKAKR
jgi:hypothetical protein